MKSSSVPIDAATFGDLLRLLRRRMGLTQGELAAQVGFSTAQISRLEKNARLPDLTMVAETFVPALGLDGEPHLTQRLLRLAALARGERPPDAVVTQRKLEVTVLEEIIEDVGDLLLPPTAIIGRDRDLASIRSKLLDAPGRLLTLVGPPGVGKTRLAQAIAGQLRDLFADGLYFIPLATVTNPEQLATAITTHLGLTEANHKSPTTRLIEHLRSKEVLCVLDNVEQLLPDARTTSGVELETDVREGVRFIAELLAQCPALRLLVTSRAPLRLRAEQRYKVAPLPPAAAVELFLQRAQAIEPDFPMTEATITAAATICLQLDCLPLAIELLAARVDILTPQQLLMQLQDNRLDLLDYGPHDLPEHQRTLRNAIRRSYALLSEAEQLCFRTLSAFTGGSTEAALEAILTRGDMETAAAGTPQVERLPPTIQLLRSLVVKNLLQVQVVENSTRYVLLETLREYGMEQLNAQNEEIVTRAHHANHFLTLAQQAASEMHGHTKKSWLDILEREHDNLRSALLWLLTHNAPHALALAVALEAFWSTRGYDSEARGWLRQALTHNLDPSMERAAALIAAANLARHQADYAEAQELMAEGLALYRTYKDPPGIARTLRQAGWLAYDRHELAQTLAAFNESLSYYRQLNDCAGIADLLLCLVHILRGQPGEEAQVACHLQESLQIYRKLDRPEGMAQALQQQAEVEIMAGHYAEASTRLNGVLKLWRSLGAKMHIAWALVLAGECAWLQGDLITAHSTYAEALPLFTELENKDGLMITLHHQGQVARRTGDLTLAQTQYNQSLQLAQTLDNRHMIARCFAGLGGLACAVQHFSLAAECLATAQHIFAQLSPFLAEPDQIEYEELIVETRTAMGEEAFNQHWQRGLTLLELGINPCADT